MPQITIAIDRYRLLTVVTHRQLLLPIAVVITFCGIAQKTRSFSFSPGFSQVNTGIRATVGNRLNGFC
jgi:hypothetical protein